MNPINLHTRIDELIADYRRWDPHADDDIPPDAELRAAPLLTLPRAWREAPGEPVAATVDNGEWLWTAAGCPRLPFPTIRAHWPAFHGIGETAGIVWARPGSRQVCALLRMFQGSLAVPAIVASFERSRPDGTCDLGVYLRTRGGFTPVDEQKLKGLIWQMVMTHLWFYAYPAFQPVVVEPEPALCDGRSTEWRQARRFYTVVHRRSGRQAQRGAGAEGERTGVLTAHARRAHVRVLRSEKWGAKRGTTLWVRAAWVGPREWRDAASRQVYRVADDFTSKP